MTDRKARIGRKRDERRERRTKKEFERGAKTKSEGTRLGRKLKEGRAAEAVAERGRKDDTAAQRPHVHTTLQEEGATLDALFQTYLKKDTRRGKETEKGIELETERGIEKEGERETGIERVNKIAPVATEEMTEIKILALGRRGKEREDDIQAAESVAFQ